LENKRVQFIVFAAGVNFIGKMQNAEAAVDASLEIHENTEKYVSMCSCLFNGIQGKFIHEK
jgi:hypothetical protein